MVNTFIKIKAILKAGIEIINISVCFNYHSLYMHN